MTCSFSTANLLSRDKDLGDLRKEGATGRCGKHNSLDHVPVYRELLELIDRLNVNECVSD